jgi:hypothetical protein
VQEFWGVFEMRKEERDVLEVLKSELEYLRSGAYAKRESWGPRFIFEDSPTCLNFGHKDNPSPCSGCVMMDFVPPEYRSEKFPCRYIPLDASGQTLDSLYRHCGEGEVEQAVCNWLETTIRALEHERETYRRKDERMSFSSGWWRSARGSHEDGTALYEKFHPKCANPACPAAFHWLAGGKFFRFLPEGDTCPTENQYQKSSVTGHHGIKHYWLCERCSGLFTLVYQQEQGVVLKPHWLELPIATAATESQ